MKFFTEKQENPSKEKEMDIKTLLKLAKQYLDENNVKKAQQLCKKALRKNNQNYMALVLLGKSYGKTEFASLSFEKAIELKPENPLAWQGLAHYYEGKDEQSAKAKLLNVYDKILSLNIDEDYAKKTLKKQGQLGCLLKSNDTITSFIQYIRLQENEQLIGIAKKQVLQLLRSNITCKNEDVPDIIDILKNLDTDDLSADDSELILLGQLIFQNNHFMYAVEEIITLDYFPTRFTLKTWLCKLLCEIFIKQNTFRGFNIDKYINVLVAGIEDTKYGIILIAITHYTRNNFEEAYNKCMTASKENLDEIEDIEGLFLLKCSKMSNNVLRTKNLCYYLLRKEHLNYPAFVMAVNAILLSCHIQEKQFYRSLYYLRSIPIGQIDTVALTDLEVLYSELGLENDIIWETLQETDYMELFRAFAFMKHENITEAINILMAFNKHPLKYYFLGKAYSSVKLNDKAFENFQKAGNFMPNHPKINFSLGAHYYRYKRDLAESKKYLEKSYAFCKTDKQVVKLLSTVYIKLDMIDLEYELLHTAFHIPETRELWLCIRLGYVCYHRASAKEALTYLQAAINMQPDDITAQEMIGDIYYNRKAYDQAYAAYNKVVDLTQDGEPFFKCLGRIGAIYSEKMLYYKAICIFDNVLDNDPSNVEALKGITENRITMALKNVANDQFQDAREQMQHAFDRITTSMIVGIRDVVCWLLYGDVLVFMTRLPNQNSYVLIKRPEGTTRKEKIDMYKMAIEGYSNIIKYRNPCALFKCALTYFEYYYETRNIAFCKAAYNLAVLYMKVNPNVWPNWDLLGKICYHLDKGETTYYCFSKALSLCEDNEFKVWCDLGLFYLKRDKHQLASYKHVIERSDLSKFAPTCFKEGTDNGSNNNDNLEIPNESPLCAENVNKVEFTEWIRNFHPLPSQPTEPTFDSPFESLRIVPNAIDILEWYLSVEGLTASGLIRLGNFQVGKKLYTSALQYYDQAYTIANDEKKNEILSLKGRVFMRMRDYKGAVIMYSEVRNKNLHDTCALAAAFFKLQKYKKSYASYDKALKDLCENDEQRIHVLIAMSDVAYRINGLCEGAMLILRAIKIKCGEGNDSDSPLMKSCPFKKDDIQLVAHIMFHYLHKYIDKATCWYYMGINFLRGISRYAKITRACLKRAIRTNSEPRRNGKLYALISVAEFYAGNRRRALSYATRALRLYPVQPELWAVFILCLYTDRTWPRKASVLRVVIDIVQKLINASRAMDKWLKRIEKEPANSTKKMYFAYACNPKSLT